jgi:hypothetical protein
MLAAERFHNPQCRRRVEAAKQKKELLLTQPPVEKGRNPPVKLNL